VAGFDDARLRYIHQENRGATAAFNTGVARSSGEYIGILGSDDWYVEEALPPLARALDADPALGAAAGGYIMVDAAGRTIEEARPWTSTPRPNDVTAWFFSCPVLLQAALFRRTWVERVGGFDPRIRISQDWDFGLRLAYAGCPMVWVERPVFYYCLHGGNSIRNSRQRQQDVLLTLDTFFGRPDLSPELRAWRGRAYAWAYLSAANQEYALGEIETARNDLAQAIQEDPAALADGGERLAKDLATLAANPLSLAAGAARQIERIWDNLPPEAAVLAGRRNKALAEAAALRFFAAYQQGNRREVWRAGWEMLRHEPARIRNSGVLSILVQGLVGMRVP
ncbi:MAG: glycosyltransferase, partial [Phycisphaerae bacterium]